VKKIEEKYDFFKKNLLYIEHPTVHEELFLVAKVPFLPGECVL
jgi:hypothetical protein